MKRDELGQFIEKNIYILHRQKSVSEDKTNKIENKKFLKLIKME